MWNGVEEKEKIIWMGNMNLKWIKQESNLKEMSRRTDIKKMRNKIEKK